MQLLELSYQYLTELLWLINILVLKHLHLSVVWLRLWSHLSHQYWPVIQGHEDHGGGKKRVRLTWVSQCRWRGLSKQLLLNNSNNSPLTCGAVPGLVCSLLAWQAHKIDGVMPGLHSAGSWVINVISTYLVEIFIVNKKYRLKYELWKSFWCFNLL